MESRHAFAPLLEALPEEQHVLVPDLRGHGAADKPEAGYLLTDLVDDLLGTLDWGGINAAVIVGASSGGYVAQQMAVCAPERVAGLVLSGTPRSLFHRRPPFAEEIEALTDPVDPEWARSLTEGMAAGRVSQAILKQARLGDAANVPAVVWRASLAGLTASPPPTEQGPIAAPTLVISGGADELLRHDAEELAAVIPRSRLVEYEDTGHLVHLEQPQRLATDVMAFLRELGPAPPAC